MLTRLMLVRMISAVALLATPSVVLAQQGPPLQIDARIQAQGTKVAATFQRRIRPGVATVSGRVLNLAGGETALVKLHFDYDTDADVALDEIISLIVISIEDCTGTEVSRATIGPNDVNLNPNRAALHYSATLYKPAAATSGGGYLVRVRVYGNYE